MAKFGVPSTKITIRRPNGEIEVVVRDEAIGSAIQRQMTEATRKAGRGEILSFELIDTEIPTEMERLLSERRSLVASIQGAIEDSDAAFEEAHAREDVRAWDIKRQYDGTVTACRAALADFDSRHPDVLAHLNAEKQAATERSLAND